MLTRTAWTVLIVPPISLLLLCLLGLVLDLRRRISRVLVLFGLGGLLLLALPITSQLALSVLESGNAGASGAEAPGAIVILSGEMAHTASGFANGPATLERLRMGAELWRQTKLPLLVSGAGTWPGEPAAANLMAESLRTDFNVPVRWIEGKSRDTWENAQYSAAVLHGAGIHSVYLVTHAWHMKRALMAFARSGIVASPAPVPADLGPDSAIYRLLPHASAWDTSYVALHEAIGLVFYELRHP